MREGSRIGAALCAILALVGVVTAARAQTPEEFYRGRAVTLVVSFAPGGLNDFAGRLLARHLGRFVPGQPSIVVQNMGGAGGLVAANHLYNVALKDGSVIGQLDRSVAQSGLRGAANVKFDPLRFTWLGSLSSFGSDAYGIWLNSKFAGGSPRVGVVTGGSNHFIAKVARDVLGMDLRIVAGYPGGAALWLAFLKGEIDGQPMSFTSVKVERPEIWEGKGVRGVVAFGRRERLPALPDVPTARELAGGDARKLALIEFAELPFLTSIPFVAPPDLPAARASALQAAFTAMVKDDGFVAEAEKLKIELSPIGGEEIVTRMRAAASTPREVIDAFNRIADFSRD